MLKEHVYKEGDYVRIKAFKNTSLEHKRFKIQSISYCSDGSIHYFELSDWTFSKEIRKELNGKRIQLYNIWYLDEVEYSLDLNKVIQVLGGTYE